MTKQPPNPFDVPQWTGKEIYALRVARRMTVRRFAAYLGVSDRMVSKWESGNRDVVPQLYNQQALDITLERANAVEKERFTRIRELPVPTPKPRLLSGS
jgi:transcriptional regulator with XRE-family HTH domain